MIVTLDIGNTNIYGGVFVGAEIALRFRYPSGAQCTSDVFGLFLKDVLDRNGLGDQAIEAIVISSVVPALDYSIVSACRKYFAIKPLQLKPGVKTGLNLDVKNPIELGADRIANAIAALHHFPKRNVVVVDFGTATTICAISKNKVYLGGAILPGFKLSMRALSTNAAKLLDVDILCPDQALGRSTTAQMQSGLFYGQLGSIKEIVGRICDHKFQGDLPVLIATGGYAHLFDQSGYFDAKVPDLVFHGLRLIWQNNQAPK